MRFIAFCALIVIFSFSPSQAHAVLAPDFLVQIGTTVGQLFALGGVVAALIYGFVRHGILHFIGKASRVPRWVDAVVLFIVIAFAITYAIITQKQLQALRLELIQNQTAQQESYAP